MQKGFATLEMLWRRMIKLSLTKCKGALSLSRAAESFATRLAAFIQTIKRNRLTINFIRSSKGGHFMQKGFATLEMLWRRMIKLSLTKCKGALSLSRAAESFATRLAAFIRTIKRNRFTINFIRSSKGKLIMQKGFATLEIIFATLIITLLMSVAIPNAVRIVDRVSLDYETKRLYSELRFLQTMNRSGRFNLTGTGLSINRDELIYIHFTAAPPSYQVVRGLGRTETPVREPHYLSYGVKLSWKSGQRLYTISSDSLGNLDVKSDTLILTSRLGKTNGIVFDSVGRLQGDRQ